MGSTAESSRVAMLADQRTSLQAAIVLPDEKILAAINELINDIKRNPFKGLRKPEPLKHALQGWWSRRISGEDRLVSRVSGKDGEQQQDRSPHERSDMRRSPTRISLRSCSLRLLY
jgi:Txe/YoeB family toxin of toxin-antitoxin system